MTARHQKTADMELKGLSQPNILRTALLASVVLFVLQCSTQAQVLPEHVPSKPPLSPTVAQDLVKVVEDIADLACNKSPYFLCPSPPPPRAPSPPTPGTVAPPVPPAPVGPAPGPVDREDAFGYTYPLSLLSNTGVQTRTAIDLVFPQVVYGQGDRAQAQGLPTSFFEQSGYYNITAGNGVPYLAPSPEPSTVFSGDLTSYVTGTPAPAGSNGAWSLYSTDSGTAVIHLTPLSNGQLFFMERPGNREVPPVNAAVYNLNNNTYRYFSMTDSPFCSGHIQLYNDKILIAGGDNLGLTEDFVDGRYNIRVFTGGAMPNYQIVARMQPFFPPSIDPNSGARWYPTLCTMVDGNVMIISGQTLEGGGYQNEDATDVNPTYQFFLPANNSITANQYIPQIQNTIPINLYPFVTTLPRTNSVMILSGAVTKFYQYIASNATLSNDTTTWGAPPPNLPVPISYPQTASIVLLPLELPSYTPRVLVVGGSSMDQAGPGTAASANTYLLDLSIQPLNWTVDAMSVGRVMPDTVLLPDGTLFICNGGDTGVAGGQPGMGASYNNIIPGAEAPEIYNRSAPLGSRFSGLLATSGRPRLYHSVAILTTNAEVLVTGSEATEDYTMQIYTPNYLMGTFVRPMLGALSNTSPGYGASVTVALSYAGGAAVPITRVVVNRLGGCTHSTHFDQRQVALVFTSTATSITFTMPPSASIAPPGIYQLFAVSNQGRPSNGVNIGVGGATPAAGPFYEPGTPPILPSGTYNITSLGRGACNASLAPTLCSQGNLVTMSNQGVWNLTYLPHGPQPNTYSIISNARINNCNTFLGSQQCTGGNGAFLYSQDYLGGLQWWTITAAAGGGYTIQMLTGREDCNPSASYLSTVACGANAVELVNANAGGGLQTWAITPTPAPPPVVEAPFVPYFTNGTYTIVNRGRTTCGADFSYNDCTGNTATFLSTTPGIWQFAYLPNALFPNTYELLPLTRSQQCGPAYLSTQSCGGNGIDIYNQDDGSGRQQWVFTLLADGSYSIQILVGRGGCQDLMTADACNVDNFVGFATSDDGSGLQRWTVTPTSVAAGTYQIINTGRSACTDVLDYDTCSQGNAVFMGTAGTFNLVALPNATSGNTFEFTIPSRVGTCNSFLSCTGCGSDVVDIYGADDGSGRQQFTLTSVPGGYTIQVLNGRTGCNDYVVAQSCATGTSITFAPANDGTGLAVWELAAPPPPPPTTQYFANGVYEIVSTLRAAGCNGAAALGPDTCATNNVFMQAAANWTLVYLPGAPNPNTYDVVSTARNGTCNSYLSCASCPGDVIDMYNQDDASGRQQWVFAAVSGGYTISILRGRVGCNDTLSAPTCAGGTTPTFVLSNSGSGAEVWSVTGAAAPPAPPPSTPYFTNGNYQILNTARSACYNYLGADACSVDNNIAMTNASGLWTLTRLTTAPNANTYEVISTARAGQCNQYLSSGVCPGGLIDLFNQDDGSGRQQWTFVQAPNASGYYIEQLQGRVGCADYVTSVACGTTESPNQVTFASAPTSTGLQIWSVIAPPPPAPPTQVLANGNYYIQSRGRTGTCATYLNAVNCSSGFGQTLVAATDSTGLQVWTLTYLEDNIYNIQSIGRAACDTYLSAGVCPGNLINLYGIDDGSGRQQWQIAAVTGGYTIYMPNGRDGCTDSMAADPCGTTDTAIFAATNSTDPLQTWSITPVNPSMGK